MQRSHRSATGGARGNGAEHGLDSSLVLADPLEKSRGAYFTDEAVAVALCTWAIRHPGDLVLDPSFGGGVFLRAASRRRTALAQRLPPVAHRCREPLTVGIEVHGESYRAVRAGLAGQDEYRLLNADFFAVAPSQLPRVQAVVGNPPFVRFQRFRGETRAQATERAAQAGVELSPLAGSWAAFVAHCTSFLAPAGRLALVVPAELGHAPYARPLLRHLHERFERILLLTTSTPLFPHLDQETLLLLAEGYGGGPGHFETAELPTIEALTSQPALSPDAGASGRPLPRRITVSELLSGSSTLLHEHLPPRARALYERLRSSLPGLGELAHVESGYVTGANRFFHLTAARARELRLPPAVLRRSVFRTAALAGLTLAQEDWHAAASAGQAGYLLSTERHGDDGALRDYLARGESDGLHLRYKTRTRRPWHRVPRTKVAPLLLAASGSDSLAMNVNSARVLAPNTFHLVTPHEPEAAGSACDMAFAWRSTLTRLSIELEGHALGGGLLKLDPGEARQVRVVLPAAVPAEKRALVDELLKRGDEAAAREIVDELVLSDHLGLSTSELATLREALQLVNGRRRSRRRQSPEPS